MLYRVYVNFRVNLKILLKVYQKFILYKVYIGEDVFWVIIFVKGDYIQFKLDLLIYVEEQVFRDSVY